MPLWLLRIRIYFDRIITRDAVSFAKRLGVHAEDLQRARAVMLFFLLFFLYQFVAFFLTRFDSSYISFYADLIFNVVILAFLLTSFWSLMHGLRQRWKDDPDKSERLNRWAREKLSEVDATLPYMLRLAGSTFVVAYLPVTLANLPQILDGVVRFDQALI
jgi:succinate dehydrogenase hydrophobic anchor subunit